MSGLVHEINSPEAAATYVKENPERAAGDMLWAIMQIQKNCACRLNPCKAEQKKGRLKNLAIQIGSSFAGGAAALYGIWVIHKENILAAVAEYLKGKMGS